MLPVSTDTFKVLETALEISRQDPRGFRPDGRITWSTFGVSVPPPVAGPCHRTAISNVPWRGPATGTFGCRTTHSAVDRTRAGLEVNLSGIAKGFAVDKVAALLESQGIQDYLVEIGGDLRLRGRSPHQAPWRIGIEKPIVRQRSLQRIIALSDGAVATSGNYRNFFQNDGLIYSHIIDPRDGMPVRHKLASVTVIAGTTMEADALSTGLMAMGPDAGPALARQAGLAALIPDPGGPGFRGSRVAGLRPLRAGVGSVGNSFMLNRGPGDFGVLAILVGC